MSLSEWKPARRVKPLWGKLQIPNSDFVNLLWNARIFLDTFCCRGTIKNYSWLAVFEFILDSLPLPKALIKDSLNPRQELSTGKVIDKPLSSIFKARHFFSSVQYKSWKSPICRIFFFTRLKGQFNWSNNYFYFHPGNKHSANGRYFACPTIISAFLRILLNDPIGSFAWLDWLSLTHKPAPPLKYVS